MTKFGLTGLLLVLLLILVAVLKVGEVELKFALTLLAGVTLGAVIAVEARHQTWVQWRKGNGQEINSSKQRRNPDSPGEFDPPDGG